MRARIYQPARNAMQSGQAKSHHWVLDFDPEGHRPLAAPMGWVGSDDPLSHLRLVFPSREAAESFAKRRGIPYRVFPPHERRQIPKSYGDNFRPDRKESWTH